MITFEFLVIAGCFFLILLKTGKPVETKTEDIVANIIAWEMIISVIAVILFTIFG